ncbi:MAG: FAD-dependent oxidoreductase [Treponema sp.]|nr:FAD-dependent oxidoreductase [Treponema sp.]
MDRQTDIIVYGGTSAGITPAIQARMPDKPVIPSGAESGNLDVVNRTAAAAVF